MHGLNPFDASKPGVKKGDFWEPTGENKVKCNLCHRKCVIAPSAYGACGVRYNHNGVLYTLVYGVLTAANIDPIEKKPLSHFNPGSLVFSISTAGCNFYCKFCDNWVLSQSRWDRVFGQLYDPEDVVEEAIKTGSHGISYTYNEPTIFYEFMYDTARLAKKKGLFNTIVTNGYMTPEAVKELSGILDAATVDFKGGGNREFYTKYMGVLNPDPIYETIMELKNIGVWIEITNLVVPLIGDREDDIIKLADWIIENLGDETPFHLLRFHPDYLLQDIPHTPVKTLEKLARKAMERGLKHVYIGNVWGHELENTYCPKCGILVVERRGFYISDWRLKNNFLCPNCGYKLNFRGEYQGKSHGARLWW
ncbi:MAG: AmmeMemoRadiSam system radical SAM enzyme [Desulfurococcaceae archaeon]